MYQDALSKGRKAMRANFNVYYTRKAIEAMTGSRAAADAAIHLASHASGWMSEDNFEAYLRRAIVSRVRRIYDQKYGHGSLRERTEHEKSAESWKVENRVCCRDRVIKQHMEDPDHDETTAAAAADLKDTPEPPAIFGYLLS